MKGREVYSESKLCAVILGCTINKKQIRTSTFSVLHLATFSDPFDFEKNFCLATSGTWISICDVYDRDFDCDFAFDRDFDFASDRDFYGFDFEIWSEIYA